jgi:Mg-chelatase subunit ChlI
MTNVFGLSAVDKPFAARHRLELRRQPDVPEAQVDEARTGDLRGLEHVAEVELADDLLRDFLRLAAEHLRQRHRAVGLVVAVARVIGRLDHGGVGRRVGDERRDGAGELSLQQLKNVHRTDHRNPYRTPPAGLPPRRAFRTSDESTKGENEPPRPPRAAAVRTGVPH